MGSFLNYQSTKKLLELAKSPFDLTKEGAINKERIESFKASALDFQLLYAMQRVDKNTLDALFELAKEAKAVEKMKAVQNGEIMNQIEGFESEKRSVLHTAMRDFFDNPNQAPAALEATKLAKQELDKLQRFIEKVDLEGKFTDLILIGIGGSDLGPRALYMALQPYVKKGRRAHFVSNVDPDDAAQVLKQVDPKKTLVVVISKSGGTLETLTNEELVKSHFAKFQLNPKDHFVAVTGKGSPLDNPDKYLASFYMWDYIGGRYSATSMVGGVLFAFTCGFSVYSEVLKGAHAMDQVALKEDPRENLPLLMALLGIWNRNFLNCPTLAIIPYSQALIRFTAHLQQCDMESNGKHTDRHGERVQFHTGPIIWGEPGTNAQHSFFQLIHQGTDPIPVDFVGFKESQQGLDLEVKGTLSQEKLIANFLAQSYALATGQKSDNPNKTFEGNRPSSLILAKKLTPYHLGALLALYEHKVAFQGLIWDINSFDQEGVQLGKLLATRFLDLMIAKRKNEAPKQSFEAGEALLKIIDSL